MYSLFTLKRKKQITTQKRNQRRPKADKTKKKESLKEKTKKETPKPNKKQPNKRKEKENNPQHTTFPHLTPQTYKNNPTTPHT